MKPAFLIGAAVIAILGVAAIAYAASGNDDDTATNNQTPASESPIPVEPDGGIGNTPDDKPIPVEPDGGIGNTPDTDKPIPVEPDGGIGDGAGPIPVEPDGGIGNTPGGSQGPAQPVLADGRHTEPAPIDGLDVRIAESFPPQYFLHIVAGLPGGCAEEYAYSFTRSGNNIAVEVLNSLPDGAVACTMIYGMYEVNIALGSDFVSGETYTVSVNDGAAETEFTAQ